MSTTAMDFVRLLTDIVVPTLASIAFQTQHPAFFLVEEGQTQRILENSRHGLLPL